MTVFELQAVPSNVPKDRLYEQVKLLAHLKSFQAKERVVLTYLGGITNHGLSASKEGLFVRIPGINSTHFVDRKEELDTLEKLAEHGLYPRLIEAYAEGALKGYKVEPLIEGETLQFEDFFKHQFAVLPSLKALHDSKLQFAKTYDILEHLLTLCEALPVDSKVRDMSVSELKNYVYQLQAIKKQLFAYPIALSPCHNDITPVNFIKLRHPQNGRQYQLIDWEYAGMGDAMYDIAGVAAMLGMPLNESEYLVRHYFDTTDTEKYAEEIKRVKFYMPLVKLYYAVWAALQVLTGNESTSIDELKNGWGPESLSIFLEQYHSKEYQALINA